MAGNDFFGDRPKAGADASTWINAAVILFSLALMALGLRSLLIRSSSKQESSGAAVPFAPPRREQESQIAPLSSLDFTPKVEVEAVEPPPNPAPPSPPAAPKKTIALKPPARAPAPAASPARPQLVPVPSLGQSKSPAATSSAFLSFPPDARKPDARASAPAAKPESSPAAGPGRREMTPVTQPSGQ